MSRSISDTKYATHTKSILALVNELRSLGAQSDLDLPRIAVIGNQSAGKSSVVEAISGISVPRDAGTCTRCPMEIRLSSSTGPWSCKISIRYEFDGEGQRLADVLEVPCFSSSIPKSGVEHALRVAQTIVLDPVLALEGDELFLFLLNPELLLLLSTLKNTTPKGLQFSRNIICVDLEGPELPDLSFIDLPGLIQNAEPDIVALVEDLVVSHIGGRCLILAALPMTDDIENQKAMALARKVDPEGKRTIGVMTKPDMLTAGSTKALELWLEVIEGRRHPLAHGYYCTRQPNDAERAQSISSVQARSNEAQFFCETSPWANSNHRSRFGIENLISTLGRQLVGIISEALPQIRQKAVEGLDKCQKKLKTIPAAATEDPAIHLSTLVARFADHVQAFVRGDTNSSKLIRENSGIYVTFKNQIRSTAPYFVPLEASALSIYLRNTLHDEEGLLWTKHPFNLTDMRTHIVQAKTRELPGDVPFPAKVELVQKFQITWQRGARTCLEGVKTSMSDVLADCIRSRFARYELLSADIKNFITDLVDSGFNACLPMLNALIRMEKTPYTQNNHYLQSCTEDWLARYRNIRRQTSGKPSSEFDDVDDALAALAKIGYTGVTSDDLAKLNPPDEYETELKLMADVRAYFQVTYKRIIDNIPSFIDSEFVKVVGADVHTHLIEKLGLGTAEAKERSARYLAEDPALVAKREGLLGQQRRFISVQKQLDAFVFVSND